MYYQNEGDFISSETLLHQCLHQLPVTSQPPLTEVTFYLQCLKKSDKYVVSVHELGRHKIRMYGYEPFVPKVFEMNDKLDMENIVLSGRWSADNKFFVVEASEFCKKNIEFQGKLSSVRLHEAKIRSKENTGAEDSRHLDNSVNLSAEEISKLIDTVEAINPGLISTPTASPSKTHPVFSEFVSPESLCFGDRKRPLHEPLSPALTSGIDGSDEAFEYVMDCSNSHFDRMDSSAMASNLIWTPIPSPVVTYGSAQPSFEQSARRSLCFPQAPPAPSVVPPFQNTVQPVGASNFANVVLMNNVQQVKPVRFEVVRHQGTPQPLSSAVAYTSVFRGPSSRKSMKPKTVSKQHALQRNVASNVAKSEPPPSSSDVVVFETSESDNMEYNNGVPCYSILGSDGTKQLLVCEFYFIREVQRYEGYIRDWSFLREDENHAYYYRNEIHVDINKVGIPGRRYYEIVEGNEDNLYFRIQICMFYMKVCDVKQDVFPYFYKNSSQYKRLSEEEQAKYILCDQGPMPPFAQGKYKSHYYLKEIDCNALQNLAFGYHYISRYYKMPKAQDGTHMCAFSLEYYQEVMESIELIDRSLGKKLAEQRRERELKQKKLHDIPKKSLPVKKSGSVAKKNSGAKGKLSGSDEDSLSEKDDTEDEDEVSYDSDEYFSYSDFSDGPGGFYNTVKKLNNGEISFPKESKGGKKRKDTGKSKSKPSPKPVLKRKKDRK